MNRDTRISTSVSDAPFMGRESLLEQERHPANRRRGDTPAGNDRHGEPETGDEERLRRALERPAAEPDPALAGAVGAQSPRIPGFPQAAAPRTSVPGALSERIGTEMAELADRLMVDAEGGERQVRIDLKDEALPGVTLVIQEREGRLQVDFVCREEAVRVRLNREAEGHAAVLASRLEREVLLRVMADDEEFPCIHEAAARP